MVDPGQSNSDSNHVLSIGELADAAGVSRRLVRFYVQRELIPPPTGKGRGSHYSPLHLELIQRILGMQAEGHLLEEIKVLLKPFARRGSNEPESFSGGAGSELTFNEELSDEKLSEEQSEIVLNMASSPEPQESSEHYKKKLAAKWNHMAQERSAGKQPSSQGLYKRSAPRHVRNRAKAKMAAGLWTRVEVFPGVELNVDTDRHQLLPDDLKRLKEVLLKEFKK